MALDNIFGIAGSALNAQTARMNATASNLARLEAVAFIRAVCALSAEPAIPKILSSAMLSLPAMLCECR